MPGDQIARSDTEKTDRPPASPSAETGDPKQKALALGMEFSKRALEAESLDDLFFMLTNDIRILTEFDRALLITHIGGKSNFVAATNQPILQKKFEFYDTVSDLAGHLRSVDRGVWLSAEADAAKLSDEELPAPVRERLEAYIQISGCSFLLCVPLKHNKALLGHLLLEFYGNTVPNQIEILTLLSVAPFFASALAEKWLIHERPDVWSLVVPEKRTGRFSKRSLIIYALVLLAAAAAVGILLTKVTYTVGGECQVVPREKTMAFVKIDGLVKTILVREGSEVAKGQTVAVLDSTELDHEIKTMERKLDILTKEMVLLRRESGIDPSKLAERNVVRLKRSSAAEELRFLRWKHQFLEIEAPASGIVVTKEIDSFVGKRFKAGEPFCEIAEPGRLWVNIYVPEDKISLVKKGQSAFIYLNSDPDKGYAVEIAETAYIAEVLPRLGNVFIARAHFSHAPKSLKVGMKGIGKIETQQTYIFRILYDRILTRWNQLSIYF
jgi:hypothetical protein